MIITDFDGTLYSDFNTVSGKDLNTLQSLGKKGITRVIATGRSLYSCCKVIEKGFPLDYLVFSSGAGIMDWKTEKILKSKSLGCDEIEYACELFKRKNLNFMLHRAIPDNHLFYYYTPGSPPEDFIQRCRIYSGFSQELNSSILKSMKEACQFVLIMDSDENSSNDKYEEIRDQLPGLKVIRTTSPIDRKSLWLEIFPAGVSKGKASAFIANIRNIDYKITAAVGNDYNDIDMLSWASKAFVVANAPDYLKKKFTVVKSNNDSGFSEAAEIMGFT